LPPFAHRVAGDDWSGLLVLVLRVIIGKASMRKSQLRSASVWGEFDRDNRLGAFCTCWSGNPCETF